MLSTQNTGGQTVAAGTPPAHEARREGRIISTGCWVPAQVEELPGLKGGPLVRLADGSILTTDKTNCCISRDEGQTWSEYPIFTEPGKYLIDAQRALVRTRRGVIILAFANNAEEANNKWQQAVLDSPGAIRPTYAVRSLDGGKTWQDLQKLHNDYTGAIRDMIETRDGNVVFTTQMMRHNPGRNVTVTFTTKDDGRSWVQSNVIDMGGVGDHSGVIEATIEQLRDGRIWMLMRTNWGKFWEAFSTDEGLSWKNIQQTKIDASSSPGMLKRLQSGRLVLVWNRYFPEGKTEVPLRGGGGSYAEVPASWQRAELSIMFSGDDGKTWSKPVVIARLPNTVKGSVTYARVFEAKPGELWISAGSNPLRVKLFEKDFL
jgi:Neuraminidase (sialidase)